MGLTTFFKRKTPGDATTGTRRTTPTFDAVEKVRTRTRQRLIGAVVLLTIGVIGFPLLFESQPRPIPVDIPIEIPRQDSVPALVLPAQRREAAAAPADAKASGLVEGVGVAGAGVTRESPADLMPSSEPSASAGSVTPSLASSQSVRGKVEVVPGKPASAAETSAANRAPLPPVKVASDVAAGRAPLPTATPEVATASGSAPESASEGSPRFVVQVGAFADPAAARELRSKMEKLGLKTYTQVAETSAGKRIRVRLGPFATRAEADKAKTRSKDAGIAAVVLTL